jgi:hypothetical protein
MSYVITPSASSGSGVQNPMTATLDANGNSIISVKDLEATRRIDGLLVVASQAVAGATVTAGSELAHSDPAGTVGFYGVPPVPQAPPLGPFVGANPVQNEQAINDLLMILGDLGLIG